MVTITSSRLAPRPKALLKPKRRSRGGRRGLSAQQKIALARLKIKLAATQAKQIKLEKIKVATAAKAVQTKQKVQASRERKVLQQRQTQIRTQQRRLLSGFSGGVINAIPDTKTSLQRQQERINVLATKNLRGTITQRERAELAARELSQTTARATIGVISLPVTLPAVIKKVIKDPKIIRRVPASIERGGAEFGELLRVSPDQAIARIGGEVLVLVGTGGALRVAGTLSKEAARSISKFKFTKTSNKVLLQPDKKGNFIFKLFGKDSLKKLKGGDAARLERQIRKQADSAQVARGVDRQKGVNDLTRKLANEFERSRQVKLGLSDRLDLEKRIAETIRRGLDRRAAPVTLKDVTNIAKDAGFIRRAITKITEGRKGKTLKQKQKEIRQDIKKIDDALFAVGKKRLQQIDDLSNRLTEEFIRRNQRRLKREFDIADRLDIRIAIRKKIGELLERTKKPTITLNVAKKVTRRRSKVLDDIVEGFTGKKKKKKDRDLLKREKQLELAGMKLQTKKINEITNKLTDEFIRRNKARFGKPLSFPDTLDLRSAIRKKIVTLSEKAKKPVITLKQATRATKKGSFTQRLIERVTKKKKKKGIEKADKVEAKRLLAQRTKARPAKVKQVSTGIADVLINRSGKTLNVFERTSLIKVIERRLNKQINRGKLRVIDLNPLKPPKIISKPLIKVIKQPRPVSG